MELTKKESAEQDYKRHKESYIKRATKWNKENLEKHREYDRRWKEKARKDPVKLKKMRDNGRKLYWKDPQKHRDAANEKSRKLKRIVFEHYGLSCSCCGESIYEFLTIDHINNDGAEHRRKVFGKTHKTATGSRIYFWLIKNNFPEGFQTLCFNCNCGKKINKGICPHKKEEIINDTN